MTKFVVPMWTAKAPDVRKALHHASIALAEANGRWGELKAIVEAESAEDAVSKVRRAVGHDAAVPPAASPTPTEGWEDGRVV